jgi:outer membrane usher protein FimD/PapC
LIFPDTAGAEDEPRPELAPAEDALLASAELGPDMPLGTAAGPAEQLYASIAINDEPKGTFLVAGYPGGEFAVRQADLVSMGIERLVGRSVMLEGEAHFLLGSVSGITFAFDERRVHIAIQIDPTALRGQVVDARRRASRAGVLYPRDTSAFFNYGYTYDDSDYVSRTLSGEIGIRSGDFLFLSDGFYERLDDGGRGVRLRTSLTYENRETLQQGVLGDFIAGSGALGSALNLGGVSFSRNYRIDPYFIRYPFASYAGLASTPSRYDVLVNGNRISSGKLEPGPFDITSIQGPLGVSDVEVVVRDAYGREQRYETPFYFTQLALRQGLDEYSFALGGQREQFGTESNRYGPLAATGFYRYGISDFVTLGGRAEASEDVLNLGPNFTLLAGMWGLFNTTLSYSDDSGDDGLAGAFDYAIQTRRFNASARLLAQSRQYARIGADPELNSRIEAGTTFSYGPFSLDYLTRRPYQGQDTTAYGVSVNPRMPFPRLSLFASLRHIRDAEPRTEFFVSLNYYFQKDYSVAGSFRTIDGNQQYSGAVQKAIPIGEGWGFSAAASQFNDSRGSGHSVRPFVQYNARYASLLADYQDVSVGGETLESKRVAIQGSIAAVDGSVMLSRPVTDAFALVKVDGLENMRVYQGGELSGTTNSDGRLLVPTLGSYVDNQISVDSRDLPANFEVKRYTRLISPAIRGGGVLDFGAKRIQAVAGTLKIWLDGQASPVRYGEISLLIDGERVELPVGQDGEFFIENLAPATYTLSYVGEAGSCSVSLEAPPSDEPITEIGDLTCAPE